MKSEKFNTIKSDLYRYGGLNGFKGFVRCLKFPGFKYTLAFRLYNSTNSPFFKGLLKILARHYSIKYGFQIPYSTQIGYGLYIGHFGTIVINGAVRIGNFCNLTHNVTIGQQNRGKKKGCPTIGDYVWIGTGAVIVGNIRIGNRVLIAPNSYINFDVPDDSIALGNPAIIIPKKDAIKYYINYTND